MKYSMKMELIVPDVKIDFKEMISGFAFPLEIKNDIIYCQKNLRTYIRTHQIIVARMGNNTKLPSVRKNLDDLEKEICEINAEQKLLLIRLRVALEEYYISLRNDNIDIDPDIGNGYISRIFSDCIDDPNYLCEPISVKRRLAEKELLTKFMPDDSAQKKFAEPVELVRNFMSMNSRQISLLKPKAERFAQKSHADNETLNHDSNEKFYKTRRQQLQYGLATIKQEKDQEEKPLTLTSPAINNSRMRLLQALQKAQTLNALKNKQQQSSVSFGTKRSYEVNSPQSSTSEESPDTRETSPMLSDEPTEPAEYSQEMFLRLFGLHTLEHSKYLTQRRSKRKRRNVQNNEKSDYHYGNIDSIDSSNKVKKEYLPSRISTRGRKKKILDSDKDMATSSKISSDRSTSSSPTEEKVRVICTECLKEGDTPLCRCENCNGMFHMKCHKGGLIKQPTRLREKCCPTCYRIKHKEAPNDEQQQQQPSGK